ncbi:MAG: alkaline phosphatase family protein [Candidatus Eisenbacteria bacterium]|nr:alkaline phosphatase family protein [Candidatus Eisenbacteria bacterium]
MSLMRGKRFLCMSGIIFLLVTALISCARYGSRPRVFVLGLDGATWDLLEPWMKEGSLPNIQQLVNDGAYGTLRSIVPPLSAPAWTTAFTGVNPGKHGIFDFSRRLPGSLVSVNETARSRRAKPVWMILSERKKKVGVMNIPLTWPPDEVNGFMISGFPYIEYRGYTYPKELEEKIQPYPLERLGEELVEGWENEKLKDIDNQRDVLGKLVLESMKKEKWDLFWVVFTGSDRVQHFYWKFMDKNHPLHDPAKAKLYGNAIKNYWIAMDSIVGQIVSELPPGTMLMVISDHGFGPIYREINLSRWLQVSGISDWLSHATMGPVIITNGVTKSVLWGAHKEGWKDYEEFKNLYKEKLSSFKDPETGKQFFSGVYKREEVFGGKYVERAADIIVVENDPFFMGPGSEKEKNLVQPILSTSFSAWHRPNGIFIFNGRGIRRGHISEGGNLVDITPTILYFLNEGVPGSMDGKVLTWTVTPDYLKDNPVKTSKEEIEESGSAEEDTLTAEEAEKLKSIPYLK